MVKALYNLRVSLFLASGLQAAKKNQSNSAICFSNQQVISLPLTFNLCPVYLLPFLPQTRLLTLGYGSALPIDFGKSRPMLLLGARQPAEHKATPAFPPPHPCIQQSNICTTVHNQQTESSRSTIKISSCLALDPFV